MNKTSGNLKNTKRGSFYWKDGKPYASVTTILGVIDKPALRRWYGEQVYIAMLNDPTMQKEAALAAPYEISNRAKDRGTTIHSLVEAYKKGNRIEDENIPKQFMPYARAFYKWTGQHPIEIVEQEKSIFSDKHRYAGTLDMLVKINNHEELTVLDIKTGRDIYREAFMQTAAYQNALREQGTEAGSIAILLLQGDGTYKFEVMSDFRRKFGGFLACKTIWEALNEEMLKKIGYLKEGGE